MHHLWTQSSQSVPMGGPLRSWRWQVYFTKDEASIREDQAKAEAERARKAKQDHPQRVSEVDVGGCASYTMPAIRVHQPAVFKKWCGTPGVSNR